MYVNTHVCVCMYVNTHVNTPLNMCMYVRKYACMYLYTASRQSDGVCTAPAL